MVYGQLYPQRRHDQMKHPTDKGNPRIQNFTQKFAMQCPTRCGTEVQSLRSEVD